MNFKEIVINLIDQSIHLLQMGADYTAKAWGFSDWITMNQYIFFLKTKGITLAVLIASLTFGLLAWIESWVFSPAYTYVVFLCLMFAESILGTLKAIRVDKERFNLDKSARIIPKAIAHTFALSASWHMSNAEPLFTWMPSTVFIFFSIQNFMKAILHLVDLKYMEGSFANFMRNKFSQNNDFIPTDNENKRSGDQDPS
jgi:hypothetical protein